MSELEHPRKGFELKCNGSCILLIIDFGDVLAFAPPLVIDADQIAKMMNMVSKSLDETYEMAQQKDLI